MPASDAAGPLSAADGSAMLAGVTPIYLDHNATTPLLPEVVDAMLPYLREHFGNPSSSHVYGQRAARAVERAREQVAALLGCEPDELVFTSGGTEANNLAIRGVTAELEPGRLVTSNVEHPATTAPCRHLEARGWRVDWVPVATDGRVSAAEVESHFGNDTRLVTIMHANNETGALQPIREIAERARARGILVHTDAAQSVGKLPVRDLGVDLLSVAGHKLYAPKGVGALYVRRGTRLGPLLLGASHERGLRPGTENVASIVGLGKACELASDRDPADQVALRDLLWARLQEAGNAVALNGHPTERLPNTLNVRFAGVLGSRVLAEAPEIAASTGSACHEHGEAASAVLLAMGLDEPTALGSVRLSLGVHTSRDEVLTAAKSLLDAFQRARR